MTYYTYNKRRKYAKGYGFMSFAKNFVSKYGKKFLNKGISASKRINTMAKNFNESKYGKTLKKEGSTFLKTSGQKAIEKVAPAVRDYVGSKIADKITSLKVKDKEEPQEEPKSERFPEEEIIIPPGQRQKIINDLRLF